MRGDNVILSPESRSGAEAIVTFIDDSGLAPPLAVGIAGESGAGKSSTALSLAHLAAGRGLATIVISQDDYFHLPPADNHARRLQDLSWVGPGEVDLRLLDEQVASLKAGVAVKRRVVSWEDNSVGWEEAAAHPWDLVVVEGTYVSLLESLDVRAFIDRTYRDTRADRIARARERVTSFIETVLAIEHDIIAQHRDLADIVI